jgi:hypothetical protein
LVSLTSLFAPDLIRGPAVSVGDVQGTAVVMGSSPCRFSYRQCSSPLAAKPWGFVLTGGLLVMLAIETISIAVDQLMGNAADPASPAASAEVVPVMVVLTVIGLLALTVYLRALAAGRRRA